MKMIRRKTGERINKFLHLLVTMALLLQPVGTPGLLMAVAQDKTDPPAGIQTATPPSFDPEIKTYKDSGYTETKNIFVRGEKAYIKANDLDPTKYYKIELDEPGTGNDHWLGSWENDKTEIKDDYGNFDGNDNTGKWEVNLWEAENSSPDSNEKKITDSYDFDLKESCGDGVTEGKESCDDGNAKNGDGCSSVCEIEKVAECGNDVQESDEECDGKAGVPGAAFQCSDKCKLELVEPKVTICHATDSQSNPYNQEEPAKSGDVSGHDDHNGGVWHPGIADHSWGDIIPPFDYLGGHYDGQNWDVDGQAIWGRGCGTDYCGDGQVNDKEECDDGNQDNSDGCLSTCVAAKCGDGFLWLGQEICEINGTQNCIVPLGAYAGSQTCLPNCGGWGECVPQEYCGDGIKNGNEQCDDGNKVDGDGCSANCQNETLPECGDGIVNQDGEQCDDGNEINDDACSNKCQKKDMEKNKIETCTGEGELYLYQGAQTQNLGTSFTVGAGKNQLLIFHRNLFGEFANFQVKVNGATVSPVLMKEKTYPPNVFTARVHAVAVEPGDLVEISGTATYGARHMQGYLTQDKNDPVFDLDTMKMLVSREVDGFPLMTDTANLSFPAGNFDYVIFDKYDQEEDGSDDSRLVNVKIGGAVYDQTFTKPRPAGSQGAVVDGFSIATGGTYEYQVNTEDSIYWFQSDCKIPEPKCGDGLINQTWEQCDDGNNQDGDGCSSRCTNEKATIISTKIVCTDESELPNWGATKPEITIDANTATDWVNNHTSCYLASGWQFQWGDTGDTNPGDDVYGEDAGWNNFDTASNSSGQAIVEIGNLSDPSLSQLKVREVLKKGYIPFTWTTHGNENVDDVSAEIYCHNDLGNFDNDDRIMPAYGQTYYCVAWNAPLPDYDLHGYKWNDLNGNRERDCVVANGNPPALTYQECQLEPLLSSWEIFIDQNNNSAWDTGEPKTLTSNDPQHFGWYWFDHLPAGEYRICEVLQPGWVQTYPIDPACHLVTLPENGQALVEPNAVLAPTHNFGNQFTEPLLFIEKWNNRQPVDQVPGADVTYKITVTFANNNLEKVHVVDLPPAGFKYRPGSWKVFLNGVQQFTVPEPPYASPGDWNLTSLGWLTPADEVVLEYIADISLNQDPGNYPDIAYAHGLSAAGTRVLSNSEYADPFYVDTAVSIIKPKGIVPVEVDHRTRTVTNRKTKIVEKVLGATLPATGADTLWVFLAGLLAMLGASLLIVDKYGARLKPLRQSLGRKHAVMSGIVLAAALLLAQNANAAVTEISLQIETPKTPVNTNSFKIGFVSLNIDPAEAVNVKCFKVGSPDLEFPAANVEYVAKPGGNSGSCVVNAAIAPTDGTYEFYAVGTAGTDIVTTDKVSVEILTAIPGTPTDYENTKVDDCNRSITFKTANDGGKTAAVELYRSTHTEFDADASTLAQTLAIGSNASGSFTDAKPDCDQKYYYAIRALSAAGLGSDFVGDRDVDVKYKTKTRTKIVEIAGPVIGGGAAAGEGQLAPGTETTGGEVLGEEGETSEEEAGETLGAGESKPLLSGPWPYILAVGAGIYIYFYLQKKRSTKPDDTAEKK